MASATQNGLILVSLLLMGIGLLYIVVLKLSHKPRETLPSERTYDSLSEKSQPLPDLVNDASSVKVGVVVPCYNEEERLPSLLKTAVPFLNANYGKSWEILIVDDGSKDRTRDVAMHWAAKLNTGNHIKYCTLAQNRGKGGAVTHGMKYSSGEYILFADADDASDFTGLAKLLHAVSGEPRSIAIGSRAHLVDSHEVIQRSKLRNFLMRCFHLLVYWFGVQTIKDTQCGFKLYRREAAREIFPYMHTEGWIFDVETLVIAIKKGIKIYEIPISWHEVTGSKIDLARDSIKMAVDLVVIRFAYLFGIYSYDDTTLASVKGGKSKQD